MLIGCFFWAAILGALGGSLPTVLFDYSNATHTHMDDK